MRIVPFVLTTSLMFLACGTNPVPGAETGSGTESGTDASTTDEPTSTSTTTTGGGGACVPGTSIGCTCTDGGMGAQVCAQDGKSYEPCVCEGGSNSGTTTTGMDTTTTTTTTTGVDPSTGPDMTTTVTSESSTGPDTTTGGVCEDPGPEPNEDEDSAVDLEMQGCNQEPDTLSGVLNGETDVDWFTYAGVYGGPGCGFTDPDPTASHSLTAGENIRLCAFAQCQGPVDVECQNGATMSMSPGNRPGCCNQGNVDMIVNCANSGNESARIFLRLDQAPADSCVMYEVEYTYDN